MLHSASRSSHLLSARARRQESPAEPARWTPSRWLPSIHTCCATSLVQYVLPVTRVGSRVWCVSMARVGGPTPSVATSFKSTRPPPSRPLEQYGATATQHRCVHVHALVLSIGFRSVPKRMLARPQILVAREGARQRIAYVSGLPSPTSPLATSGTATFSWDDTAERKGPPTLGAPTQAQAETMGHAAVDALVAVAAMPEGEEDMDGGTAVVPVSEVNAGFDTSPEGHMAVLCACETSRVEYPSLGYAMKLENTWPVPVASSSEPLGSSTAPGVAPPCLPGNPTSRFVRALACRYESVPVAGHALNMGFKGSSEVLLAPPTLVAVRRREVRDDGAFMFEHHRLECIATRNTTFQAASNDIVYEPRGYTCAPDEIS